MNYRPMNIILDCDPGTDDAIAMCMAMGSDLVNLLGVTIVGGNVHRAVGARNARNVLSYIDKSQIPVFLGASRPLKGVFKYAYQYHGTNGICTSIPNQNKPQKNDQNAVDFILTALKQNLQGITLVALGPLTNIAEVLRTKADALTNIDRIYVMGGAFRTAGNVTLHAEFNIYQDPEAANIVFGSHIPVSVVGLDVCKSVYVSRYSNPWLDGHTKREKLCADILEGWFDFRINDDKYELCDPLTIAAAINSDLLTYETAKIRVVENGVEKGKTIADFGECGVEVATSVDAGIAYQRITSLISV